MRRPMLLTPREVLAVRQSREYGLRLVPLAEAETAVVAQLRAGHIVGLLTDDRLNYHPRRRAVSHG